MAPSDPSIGQSDVPEETATAPVTDGAQIVVPEPTPEPTPEPAPVARPPVADSSTPVRRYFTQAQRDHILLEIAQARAQGLPDTSVRAKYDISATSINTWIRRYNAEQVKNKTGRKFPTRLPEERALSYPGVDAFLDAGRRKAAAVAAAETVSAPVTDNDEPF